VGYTRVDWLGRLMLCALCHPDEQAKQAILDIVFSVLQLVFANCEWELVLLIPPSPG
jgi:hypothetical protein